MSRRFALAVPTLALAVFPGYVTQLAVSRNRPLATIAELGDRVNHLRVEKQLPELKREAKLTEAAQRFAEFMADTEQFGHEVDHNTPGKRLAALGYEYCLVLENIAYQEFGSHGFSDIAEQFLAGWLESPPHRRNLLDEAVTETGIGIATNRSGSRIYAVQLFARPKSAMIEFTVTNRSDGPIKYRVGDEDFELSATMTRIHSMCRPTNLALPLGSDSSQATAYRLNNADQLEVTGTIGQLRARVVPKAE